MSSGGSVKRHGRTWRFVVDLPSPDGQRRQALRRGFPTKAAAQDAMRNLLNEVEHGTAVDPSRVTVAGYLTDVWLPALEGRNLRPTTIDAYRRTVTRHLVPVLGARQLQRLDAAAVERLLAHLAQSGLSPKTRRNVVGVLSKALADALRWRLVGRNPVAAVELPRADRPAVRAWTAEQMARFLAHTRDDRLSPLWRFLVVSGCRRGEALGLRWADVDLEAGVATITNQRTIAGGRVVEGAPKTTAGARTVALDPDTIAALRAWRRVQREEHLVLGIRPEHGLVFTGPDAIGWWPQTITARFRGIADELGLPRIGIHGLRHSAATWLIAEGVSPKVVAQRLGHANVSITLGLYSHVLPAHDRAAAQALAQALAAADARVRDQSVISDA
jgi:integrase